MPRFIRHPDLAAVGWLVAEAVITHIDKRWEQIMGALVSVDSDVLAALGTLAQTVDTEVGQLISAGKIAPGDVSGIQSALNDAKSQLDAAVSAGTATSTTDPSAPDDGSTPPADPSAPVDPSAPADPTAGDGTVSTDDGSADPSAPTS